MDDAAHKALTRTVEQWLAAHPAVFERLGAACIDWLRDQITVATPHLTDQARTLLALVLLQTIVQGLRDILQNGDPPDAHGAA